MRGALRNRSGCTVQSMLLASIAGHDMLTFVSSHSPTRMTTLVSASKAQRRSDGEEKDSTSALTEKSKFHQRRSNREEQSCCAAQRGSRHLPIGCGAAAKPWPRLCGTCRASVQYCESDRLVRGWYCGHAPPTRPVQDYCTCGQALARKSLLPIRLADMMGCRRLDVTYCK